MLERLKKLEALRGKEALADAADLAFHGRVKAVKLWQQQRLRRSYTDLAADSRYAMAVDFFLDELYGTKDSAIRDRDLIRMYPTIKRLLPKFAFDTVDNALELDVLAEEFDQAIATRLAGAKLTDASYAAAFRAVGRHADRLHQVELMREVGQGLDLVVKKPLIYTTLKMLRKPAQMAGLGEMQQFLEAGFAAFRHMNGADHFLDTIAARETVLIERLFDNRPDPFAVVAEWERLNAGT
ncbi:MAG: hypothetical protein ABI790_02635 [Betaproteobacteria bacterium]